MGFVAVSHQEPQATELIGVGRGHVALGHGVQRGAGLDTELDALGQRHLFGRSEQGHASDLLEVHAHRVTRVHHRVVGHAAELATPAPVAGEAVFEIFLFLEVEVVGEQGQVVRRRYGLVDGVVVVFDMLVVEADPGVVERRLDSCDGVGGEHDVFQQAHHVVDRQASLGAPTSQECLQFIGGDALDARCSLIHTFASSAARANVAIGWPRRD